MENLFSRDATTSSLEHRITNDIGMVIEISVQLFPGHGREKVETFFFSQREFLGIESDEGVYRYI